MQEVVRFKETHTSLIQERAKMVSSLILTYFGIDLQNIDAIVLAMATFIFRDCKVWQIEFQDLSSWYAHPDAFLKRWDIFPDGTRLINPILDQAALEQHGIIVEKNEVPSGLPEEKDACLIVSGQIPRETSYEKAFPSQYAEVEGKGLVIISGCGHAGIINTINYAKKLEETKRLCSSWRLSPVMCAI